MTVRMIIEADIFSLMDPRGAISLKVRSDSRKRVLVIFPQVTP